jgi:hypothetical protein
MPRRAAIHALGMEADLLVDHVGDDVVATAEHSNATGRPQNGNQKDWHREPPLLFLSRSDNAFADLAFRLAFARDGVSEAANATDRR